MKPVGDIEIIRKILIKSREKQKTAKIDYKHERFEDSVSRAYYAVFHAISAVLFSKGLHFSSHAQTIGSFNKEFVSTKVFSSSFTKMIEKLFSDRQTGDYDCESYLDEDTAKEDMEEAEKIVKACEEYLSKKYNVPEEYWKK